MNNDIVDPYGGPPISGITAFYNEFYEKLELFDQDGIFDAILSKHSSGMNKIKSKGAILLRIVDFVLKITENNKDNNLKLYVLGKSHSQKAIRPWQYSVFIQILLMTISCRLGTLATVQVMEAWMNLFAYILQHMLPMAIKHHIIETESYMNTATKFSDEKVNSDIQEFEEVRKLKKNLSSVASSRSNTSRAPSTRIPNASPGASFNQAFTINNTKRIAVDNKES